MERNFLLKTLLLLFFQSKSSETYVLTLSLPSDLLFQFFFLVGNIVNISIILIGINRTECTMIYALQ